MKKIILASGSPRRKEILKKAGIDFEVKTAKCTETIPQGTKPADAVLMLAQRKCENVWNTLKNDTEQFVVIAADTVVGLDDDILGKPTSYEDALNMLMRLCGRKHSVYTGVCIMKNSGEKLVFFEKTDVYAKNFGKSGAEEYLKKGEYMDKAGSYAIQGHGRELIDKISGDFDNVVGLPSRAAKELQKILNTIK